MEDGIFSEDFLLGGGRDDRELLELLLDDAGVDDEEVRELRGASAELYHSREMKHQDKRFCHFSSQESGQRESAPSTSGDTEDVSTEHRAATPMAGPPAGHARGRCLHFLEHGDNCSTCSEAPRPEDAALYELAGEKGEAG